MISISTTEIAMRNAIAPAMAASRGPRESSTIIFVNCFVPSKGHLRRLSERLLVTSKQDIL